MSIHDSVAPTVEEADRRVERAKASLLSRVELLKHKIADAKERLDLPAQIARYPLPAVGVAFALGVAAGLRRGRASTMTAPDLLAPNARPLRDAALTALSALALRVVRDIALAKVGQVARQWWITHEEHRSDAANETSAANETFPNLAP
jgi:hypothetical protein